MRTSVQVDKSGPTSRQNPMAILENHERFCQGDFDEIRQDTIRYHSDRLG